MSELQESQRPVSAGAKNGAGPAPNPKPSVNTSPAVVKSTDQGISGSTTATPPQASSQRYTPVFTTDKIQHAKATRPKEYFDEQNRKRAEQKQQNQKLRKRILAIGIPSLVVVAAAVVTLVVILKPAPTVTTPEENQKTAETFFDQAMNQIDMSYESSTGSDTNAGVSDETISEANVIFETAISEAVQNNNTGEADAVRVAQMLFYINVGTDYAKMIEIGESVENIEALELQQQLQFYNIMTTAYIYTGNEEQATIYYAETLRIVDLLGSDYEEGEIEEGEGEI